jgi:hypothetical protein
MDAMNLAQIGLFLAQEDQRTFVDGPGRITFGQVGFGGWVVDQVPYDSAEHRLYLVRVGYDLLFAPDVPRPEWVEVGFVFGDEGVVVADALPRLVTSPQRERRYALSERLEFVSVDDAGDAVLPPMSPRVEVLGVGRPAVLWRHTPPPYGSQTGVLALLVPPSYREVRAEATVRFPRPPTVPSELSPGSEPGGFTVRLPEAREATRAPSGAVQHRAGFVVDIVGYSSRTEPGQRAVDQVSEDVAVRFPPEFRQPAGDGMNVFLPTDVDLSRTIPGLVNATVRRLAEDNGRHEDRMRWRMAIDAGPVARAAAGFSGDTIISFGRLVDSAPIRAAVADNDTDLAVLVSASVYRSVIAHGYPGLDPATFRKVRAVVKTFQSDAWLWIAS